MSSSSLSLDNQNILNVHVESSVASEVKNKNKVISKGNKKLRLVVENKNKRTDFNLALTDNPAVLKKRQWAPLYIDVKVGDQVQSQKYYVNINSIAKRLGVKKSVIRNAIQNKTLETLIADEITGKLQEIQDADDIAKAAPALKTATRKISSTKLKGAIADAWWDMTTRGWNLFRFRFILGASDEKLQKQGELRAITAYKQAYQRVPAYRKHILLNLKGMKKPHKFEDIPLTGKKEYIQKAKSMDGLYLDGQIPADGQLDSSTGTTGEPALWVRSAKELAMTKKLMSFARKAKFGNEDVILINTFALGLWATGVTITGAGPKQGLTANVGIVPDYAEKSISIITKLTNKNPNRPVVLCGYPPNIRNIADAIQKDPVLKERLEEGRLKLHAIVGGEGMTEALRQDILDKGFETVYSSYGASDLDINIGFETDTEIAIRKACIENPALAKELYGGGPPPMIFHYDPLNYYIETTKEGELVYTCCRKERASPRIRYNLHDTGKVMMAKDVVAIMKKYGVEIHPRTNLPFLFVHGREGTVSFGGAKIHYEHLEEIIREEFTDNELNMDRFALYKNEETNELEFWLEAASEEDYETLAGDLETINELLIARLSEKNTDFKKILDGQTNPYPQVRLFRPGESLMSVHALKNPHRKLQRVVMSTPEVEAFLDENPEAFEASAGDYT